MQCSVVKKGASCFLDSASLTALAIQRPRSVSSTASMIRMLIAKFLTQIGSPRLTARSIVGLLGATLCACASPQTTPLSVRDAVTHSEMLDGTRVEVEGALFVGTHATHLLDQRSGCHGIQVWSLEYLDARQLERLERLLISTVDSESQIVVVRLLGTLDADWMESSRTALTVTDMRDVRVETATFDLERVFLTSCSDS